MKCKKCKGHPKMAFVSVKFQRFSKSKTRYRCPKCGNMAHEDKFI